VDFGLFYFADMTSTSNNLYDILLRGAKFADLHGFTAVWTPERHFHPFGGPYPNPAVTGAAIAALTRHVAIRAGSVVAPLHHPLRIAEEWSVVDNLSHGRVAISFASGWNAGDFALRPEAYAQRKEVLIDTIDVVRRLWRGEGVSYVDGNQNIADIHIYPAPVQAELPVWLTSAGSEDTFRLAGQIGANVLTHLLGQEIDDLARKILTYRKSFSEHKNLAGARGRVALMLHTLLGSDRDEVRENVREPFKAYLRSSAGLFRSAAKGPVTPIRPDDMEFMLHQAFERYFSRGGLFGTVDDGIALVERLNDAGVDEVACLIDFGVSAECAINGLPFIEKIMKLSGGAR
jgi:natural product biosynthesis luciferase-like monooxygenase protein